MKWVKAEEQRADPSPAAPLLFLLLCLLHSLSVNEAQSSQEHKHWDLSSYHRLRSSARLNTLLLFNITASVSQSVCPSVWIVSFFHVHLCVFLSYLLVLILLFDSPSHPSFWPSSSPSLCCSCYCWGSEWMAGSPPSGQISLSVFRRHSIMHIFSPKNVFIAKLSPEKNSLYRTPHEKMHIICC